MELLLGIGIAIGWIFFFPFIRMLTTFFHEMGHAIPALLFTKEPVEVYIGSYGDVSKSVQINFTRLTFYFSLEIFHWKLGMCRSSGSRTFWQEFIVISGGPIASLTIALTGFILASSNYGNASIIVPSLGLALMALLDFVINIKPSRAGFVMHDGERLYSDGNQLKTLIKRSKYEDEYFEFESELYKGNRTVAKERLESKLKEEQKHQEYYYHLLIDAFKDDEEHEKVIETYERLVDFYGLELTDYRQIGMSYLKIKNYDEAIRCLNEYLHVHFTDHAANEARGYARMMSNERVEAVRDFRAAIEYSGDPGGRIHGHLGHNLYLLNDFEDAQEALQIASELDADDENGDLYYYWALFYERQGEYQKALDHFIKARDMNVDFHGFEYKIHAMEEHLGIA